MRIKEAVLNIFKKKSRVDLSVPDGFILPVGDYEIPEGCEEQRVWVIPLAVPKDSNREVLPLNEKNGVSRVNLG